jgi:ABC-type amino acid transport substrate-binding protein
MKFFYQKQMKMYFLVILCSLLICGFNFGQVVSAADVFTIRVGLYENKPKIFTDDKGNPSGFWPEIIETIASKEGWKVQYKHGTWAECLDMLEKNEIDVMPDVAYTEARNVIYDFSKESVYTSWSRIYTREGVPIQSILDLEGKTIAVLKGSVNVEGPDGIKKLVKAFNVDCTFDEVDSYTRVFELVKNKGVDAGVASKDFGYQYGGEYHLVETPIIFQPANIYFAFTKNAALTPSLMEKIDSDVKTLKQDTNSAYHSALRKWLTAETTGNTAIPLWILWTLICIGGLAFLLAIGSLIMRSRVRYKTKELTAEISMRKKAENNWKSGRKTSRTWLNNGPVNWNKGVKR